MPDMPITRLLDIMKTLRDKEHGCPWDIEQTSKSIATCAVEEAYEVVDAIEREDMENLKEELGDLLLQVVFHAQIAAENGQFNFDDIVQNLNEKLIRRHPHVFAERQHLTAEQHLDAWEQIKAEEKKHAPRESVLDDVPASFPALTRAFKLQKKAAKVGFDWPTPEPVFEKFTEELAEIREAMASGSHAELQKEVGDLLFTAVNLARKLKVEPEEGLRQSNRSFESRFRHVERSLKAQGKTTESATLEEMETLWQQAKKQEKTEA